MRCQPRDQSCHTQSVPQNTYGRDTLRPVTAMQVLDAHQPHPDGEFDIDGSEITQITFVGQIRGVSEQTTNSTYKIDDGTGTVEVKKWILKPDELGDPVAERKSDLSTGDWVRVWGNLKAFNNRRHVVAHNLRKLTDMNEINHHLLEATFVHLYFTRGPPEQFAAPAADANAYGQQQQGYQLQSNGMHTDVDLNGRSIAHLSIAAKRVLKCLETTPQNNEGLHVQNIATATGMNMQDVLKGGEELLTNSLTFTTVDEMTWAVLEM